MGWTLFYGTSRWNGQMYPPHQIQETSENQLFTFGLCASFYRTTGAILCCTRSFLLSEWRTWFITASQRMGCSFNAGLIRDIRYAAFAQNW
jgi:hypothetical protein